jgi:hypothetical protein
MENKLNLVGVMTYLGDLGFNRVQINYSGGGDSGAIDTIMYLKPEDKAEDISHYELNEEQKDNLNETVRNFVDEMAWSKLNDVEDWWNNDGGFGVMTIAIPSGKFTIENHTYYQMTETYEHEGKFNTED